MDRACDAIGSAKGPLGALLAAVFDCVEYCVDWVEVEVVVDGDGAAVFCRLAPCALKAERKLPKNGRLVVGMLAMSARRPRAQCSMRQTAPP